MICFAYDAAQLKTISKTASHRMTCSYITLNVRATVNLELIPHAVAIISVKSTAELDPKNALFSSAWVKGV